jgi:hypothetical protein
MLKNKLGALLLPNINTLFYRVEEKKLILLNFFDNRQHPPKKSY